MDKYYFQARFKWSKVFAMLNDTEIGRLTKAIWLYAETGEETCLHGKESVAFAMIIADLDSDAAKREAISNARREAVNHRWNTKDTIVDLVKQKHTSDTIYNNKDNDKENDNDNENEKLHKQQYDIAAGAEELFRIQEEHNAIIDAAEEAGFGHSEAIRNKLISLYAEHGKDKLLYGINECVMHGACTIAYLSSVCKGSGKKPVTTCCVPPRPADFKNQRSWEDDDDMEKFMAGPVRI